MEAAERHQAEMSCFSSSFNIALLRFFCFFFYSNNKQQRVWRLVHLRLAAKLEMQFTISTFCLSAPHMLQERGGAKEKEVTGHSPRRGLT